MIETASEHQMRTLGTRRTEGASRIEGDPRWTAVSARDREADGTFYYSVRTTGVYCRPSCAARPRIPRTCSSIARRRGASARDSGPASAASRTSRRSTSGTRPPVAQALPSDRGRGGDAEPGVAGQARRAEPPSLPSRVQGRHRPDAEGLRRGASRPARARRADATADTVTEAIYDAGFNSSGRFYATSDEVLGMTPTRLSRGRRATPTSASPSANARWARSWWRASAKGVCAILLGDDPDALVRDLQDRFPRATLIGGDAEFERAGREGGRLRRGAGAGPRPAARRARHRVPAARLAGAARDPGRARPRATPRSPRASARRRRCARWRRPARANALAVAIPCHRVVRHDGGCPAIAGASSASARCSSARARHDAATAPARRCAGRQRPGRRPSTGARVAAISTRRAARSSTGC